MKQGLAAESGPRPDCPFLQDQMNREIVHGMREFTTLKVDGACEEEKAGIEGHAETEEKDEVQRIAKVTRLRCMPARGPAQEETQTIIEGFSRRD